MNKQDSQKFLPVLITLILIEAFLFVYFYMLVVATAVNRGGSSDLYFKVLFSFAAILPVMSIIAWLMHVKSSVIIIGTIVISFIFISLHIFILG